MRLNVRAFLHIAFFVLFALLSGRFTQAVMRPDPSSCLRGTTCLMQNLGEPDIAPLLVSAEAAEFDDIAARRAVRHS